MPRRSTAPPSTAQAVRNYFGLTQQELATYLDLTDAQVGHLETGRRSLSPEVATALAPLVAALPPTPPAAPPALRLASAAPATPTLALGTPEAEPLAARLDYCQHHAGRLRRLLRPLEAEAAVAARWAQALPTVRAALPPAPPAEPDAATDWPGWLLWHRHRWLSRRRVALPPHRSAQYHLLRLQAEALEAEAAALQALLPAPETGQVERTKKSS